MSEKLWNINYLRAWGANFMLFFSFMLVVPLLPIFLQESFGASKEMIGLTLSGYTVVAMLTRATSGYVVDKYPRKQMLVLGYVFLTAFFAGYIIASSLMLFAAVRTLHGLPFGISTVANSTVAVDVLPASRRAEGIGYYGLSNNVATAISPSIGLWMYQTWHDFDILFWCSMGVAFLGVLCVAGIKTGEEEHENNVPTKNKDSFETNPSDNSDKDQAIPATATSISKHKYRKRAADKVSMFFLLEGWALGLAMVCYAFAYGVVSTYVAIYGKEELGILGGSGVFFALLASGLFFSRLLGSRTLRRGKIMQNATFGTCISCIGYLLFAAFHNEFGYFGCAILLGLGNGHLWPAFQNMFIILGPASRRGVANASLLTSWDLGVGLGILAGGSLIERFGYGTTFWVSWIVELSGVLFYMFYVRQNYIRKTQRA